MTFTYSLEEDDFIICQLFFASINKDLKKRRRKNSIMWGCILLICGLLFHQLPDKFLSYYLITFGVLFLLFYTIYAKWRYKKYYDNNADKLYKNLINKVSTVTIDLDKIEEINEKHEMKFVVSEIESISEIENYIYIKIKLGLAFIVPKKVISNIENARQELINICNQQNLKFVQMLDWKW